MHAKYEVSISYGSKVIAKVKVDNKQTNRQTDRQTDKQDKNNMPPIIRSGGIKMIVQASDTISSEWNNRALQLFDTASDRQKELPRVNRTYDPVEDQKSQLLSFSAILFEFCSILVKFYKNLHFTEFHSLIKRKF